MVKKIFLLVLLVLFAALCLAGTGAYSDAKWVITNSGLSYQQMLNLTPQDMRTAFPNKPMSGTRINNTLGFIRYHANKQKDNANLQLIKTQVTTWLTNNFPSYEIEKGREYGKPYVKIWLEGKPDENN